MSGVSPGEPTGEPSNTLSDDTQNGASSGEIHQPEGGRRLPLLALAAGFIAVALGLYVATQVVGVLYSIVAPPMPPLPPSAQESNHTNLAYGVDTWTYSVTMDACAVVPFYESLGATCEYAPLQCLPEGSVPELFTAVQTGIARCVGETAFSIFTMGYEVGISRPMRDITTAELNVRREVYWTRTSD